MVRSDPKRIRSNGDGRQRGICFSCGGTGHYGKDPACPHNRWPHKVAQAMAVQWARLLLYLGTLSSALEVLAVVVRSAVGLGGGLADVKVNGGTDKGGMRPMQKPTHAFCDGSVHDGRAGLGVFYEHGNPLNFSAGVNAPLDNNRAELAAAYVAVLRHPRHEPLTVFTDSRFVLGTVQAFVRGMPVEKERQLALSLRRALQLRRARTLFRKIQAHKGHPAHDIADGLAKVGARSGPDLRLPGPHAREWLVEVAALLRHTTAPPPPPEAPAVGGAVSRGPRPAGAGSGRKRPAATSEDHGATEVVAIDCEMVGVGEAGLRSVLARVCVVNSYGNVMYDSYSKPTEKVTDYRTWVSGIRPQHLAAAPAFEDVKGEVRELLEGRVVVGHAIDNDLFVLQLAHPPHLVRDTGAFRPLCRPSGRPRRLKHLAKEQLQLDIQMPGEEHSPVEDARAALFLYQKFQTRWERAVVNKAAALHEFDLVD